MTDRPDRATRTGAEPGTAPDDDEVAPPSASPGDSGREMQPLDEDSVERSADRVERLERHNRPMDDDAGINPSRTQSATGEPENGSSTADGGDSA